MNRQSLAPQTGRLIEAVSQLECIKPFVLVDGTALSIQLKTRQSEDLDFMRWQQGKNDTLDIDWPSIQRELETVGEVQDVQVAGFDQVLFVVDGVKISFYAAPRKRIMESPCRWRLQSLTCELLLEKAHGATSSMPSKMPLHATS